MANSVNPIQSPISQWTNVNKVAFWKEDNTAMKIVKFITSFIIVPLGFVMDLISKGANYVWPKKEIQPIIVPEITSENPGKIDWLKNCSKAIVNKTKSIWNNNKPIIISATVVGLAAISMWYFMPSISAFACNKTGYMCSEKTSDASKATSALENMQQTNPSSVDKTSDTVSSTSEEYTIAISSTDKQTSDVSETEQ